MPKGNAEGEFYDYRDSDTKHGNTIDSGKEILLLMDTQ